MTKKRHNHDKNKQGKKEKSGEDEQKNQKEEQNEKANVTFLTTCFSYRQLKELVVFLYCTLLMPFKIVYQIMICIWTICGKFTTMISFRRKRRKKNEEKEETQEENGDVMTRSKYQKKSQKKKTHEQEKRRFPKRDLDKICNKTILREKQNFVHVNIFYSRLEQLEHQFKSMRDENLRLREDNTPVVRDLTEPNRPMRIEIQFSELFKNEWTDAFGYTVIDDSKFKDIETIKILLKILSEIYEICLANVNQQLSGHRSTVHGLSDDEIEGFIKAVKDSIKINAPKYIPLLRKKIISDSSRCKTVFQYKDCCLLYIENSVNLCYYIVVQDPPMFIDFEPGKIFDKQSWKKYTRSGTEIEYLVWPALYLYKGGPIMSKGVVQPKETE